MQNITADYPFPSSATPAMFVWAYAFGVYAAARWLHDVAGQLPTGAATDDLRNRAQQAKDSSQRFFTLARGLDEFSRLSSDGVIQ
jgi:hypothetical protein